MGANNPAAMALPQAHLILRVTGLFMPSLSVMAIEGEIDSVERAIAEAPTNLDELEALLPRGASLDDPAVLASVPNNYREGCKEHCAMWKHCRGQALLQELPIVLGEQAAETLAPAGTLQRALELMKAEGTPPQNASEFALAQQLRAADSILRSAVG
jgi:hypothetical protein